MRHMPLRKITAIIFTLLIQQSLAQTQGEKVMLDLMKQYEPQDYAYYQYNDGIKKQGQQIAQSIASQLDQFATLNKTEDPQALINDFNNKMNNIDQLEINLEQQANSYLNNRSKELGNQIKSGDYMGAFANLAGSIESYSAMKQQAKQLEAQRAELERQKQAQMSAIWRKKYLYTVQVISQLRQQAAFAASKTEEDYYLASIDFVWCSYHSERCDQPQKPLSGVIENKFISKDAVYRQNANRKLGLYKEQQDKKFMIGNQAFYVNDGVDYFLEGAMAFAAKAATENPTADNYIFLAQQQANTSNILGFASMMVAKSINPKAVQGPNQALYDQLMEGATNEIDQALRANNTQYLDAFLKAGLDKTIRFDGNSLLVHAIAIDNPDAVQLILNHYVEGLNQVQITTKVQKVIMLAAAQNSTQTIKRLTELGVDIEFETNNTSPISIATVIGAVEALEYMLNNVKNKEFYQTKHLNSPGMILLDLKSNVSGTYEKIESLENARLNEILHLVILGYNHHESYREFLNKNAKCKKRIQDENSLYTSLKQQFGIAVKLSSRSEFLKFHGLKNFPTLYSKEWNENEERAVLIRNNENLATKLASIYIDEKLILLDPNAMPLFSSFDPDSPISAESLAFAAAYFENIELLNELDKIYDLSQVKNKNGVLLNESLEKIGFEYSMFPDFNLSFEQQIEQKIRTDPYNLWPAMTVQNLGINENWRSVDGGSILHFNAEMALKFKNIDILFSMYSGLGEKGIAHHAISTQSFKEVKKIKNSNNETVYDFLKRNEGEFKAFINQKYPSFMWRFEDALERYR